MNNVWEWLTLDEPIQCEKGTLIEIPREQPHEGTLVIRADGKVYFARSRGASEPSTSPLNLGKVTFQGVEGTVQRIGFVRKTSEET